MKGLLIRKSKRASGNALDDMAIGSIESGNNYRKHNTRFPYIPTLSSEERS